MKWVLVIVVALLLLGGGAVWAYRTQVFGSPTTQPADSTAKVEKGPIRLVVSSTGKVVSNLDVDIKVRASGQVQALPYDISQSVKTEDLLIAIDPTDAQHALDTAQSNLDRDIAKLAQAKQTYLVAQQDLVTAKIRAEASLASAQSKLTDSRAKAQRMKALLADKLASQEDYETAQTSADTGAADLQTAQAMLEDIKSQELALEVKKQDITVAQATVKSDQIYVDTSKTQLSYCQQRVPEYPPTPGDPPRQWVVSARNIQVGTIIQSAIANVSGGAAALTLSDLSRVFVLASVDESDIGVLREAVTQQFPVEISADAYPGKKFDGQVVRIATTGVSNNNVVTFEVKIEVTSKNKTLLKPQMTANVDIVAADRADSLLVPVTAVSRKKGHSYVTVIKTDNSTEQREVTPGVSDTAHTEILDGLAEGDTVQVNKTALESKWRGGGGGKGGGGAPPPSGG